MERSDFPDEFFIAGEIKEIATGQSGDYTTAFSALNNHILLEVESLQVSSSDDVTFLVTGTKVNESTKTPISNYTEIITILHEDNKKYQTLSKFYDITNISISHNSNFQSIDYDIRLIGYVDFLNTDVKITGYRAEILGDLNGPNADITLSLFSIKQSNTELLVTPIEQIKIDGSSNQIIDDIRSGKYNRNYTITSGASLWPANSQFVLKMTDFDTYFTNQENYCLGTQNGGFVLAISSSNLGPNNGPRFFKIQVYYEYL